MNSAVLTKYVIHYGINTKLYQQSFTKRLFLVAPEYFGEGLIAVF